MSENTLETAPVAEGKDEILDDSNFEINDLNVDDIINEIEKDDLLSSLQSDITEIEKKQVSISEQTDKLKKIVKASSYVPLAEREAADARSVFLKSVPVAAAELDVMDLLTTCGPVRRVSIKRQKNPRIPVTTCYAEFESVDAVEKALQLINPTILNQLIEIHRKRTNIPSFHQARGSSSPWRGRGRRGRRGRGRSRPHHQPGW
ncbi:hypothetical protein PCE1_001815 [Barthelona sp. PCE]